MTRADLINAIDAYAAACGIAPATVTSRAVSNSRLYSRLKAGRSCTLDVVDRVLTFIAENPPSLPNPEHPHDLPSSEIA